MKTRCILDILAFVATLSTSYAAPDSSKSSALLSNVAQTLRISAIPGDSYERINTSMGLLELKATDVLSNYPFKRQFGFVDPIAAAVWTDGITRPNGWPAYYIAHFDGSARTNLIDLFYVRDGQKLVLTKGRFEHKLRNVVKGMNVSDVYKELGEEECRYYQADDKAWRVRFSYRGYRGSFISIEADAASGIVLSARDGTI